MMLLLMMMMVVVVRERSSASQHGLTMAPLYSGDGGERALRGILRYIVTSNITFCTCDSPGLS